jgi:ABC-type transport system involved in cytochrome c biogenesis permease subunit
LTVTIKLFVALKLPSLTTVVNKFVLGPWGSVGVHVMMPFVLMLAFVTVVLPESPEPVPRLTTASV